MILEKEVELSGNKYKIRLVNMSERAHLENLSKKAFSDDMNKFALEVDQWFFYQAVIYGLEPPEYWKFKTIKGRKYLEENELYKIKPQSDLVALAIMIFTFITLSDEDKKELNTRLTLLNERAYSMLASREKEEGKS